MTLLFLNSTRKLNFETCISKKNRFDNERTLTSVLFLCRFLTNRFGQPRKPPQGASDGLRPPPATSPDRPPHALATSPTSTHALLHASPCRTRALTGTLGFITNLVRRALILSFCSVFVLFYLSTLTQFAYSRLQKLTFIYVLRHN